MPCRLEQLLSTTFCFISPFHPTPLPQRTFWKHYGITVQVLLSQLMISNITNFYVYWQFIHVRYVVGV